MGPPLSTLEVCHLPRGATRKCGLASLVLDSKFSVFTWPGGKYLSHLSSDPQTLSPIPFLFSSVLKLTTANASGFHRKLLLQATNFNLKETKPGSLLDMERGDRGQEYVEKSIAQIHTTVLVVKPYTQVLFHCVLLLRRVYIFLNSYILLQSNS